MRFVDRFRDPAAARRLLTAIAAQLKCRYRRTFSKFMEVCGGHAHHLQALSSICRTTWSWCLGLPGVCHSMNPGGRCDLASRRPG